MKEVTKLKNLFLITLQLLSRRKEKVGLFIEIAAVLIFLGDLLFHRFYDKGLYDARSLILYK